MHRIVVYLIKVIKMHTRRNKIAALNGKEWRAENRERERERSRRINMAYDRTHDNNRAFLLNRKDRKNHGKKRVRDRATKPWINVYAEHFSGWTLFCSLLTRCTRLSIDLFDRPKIRDVHINKANFLFIFFFALFLCCTIYTIFFTINHSVDLT